MWRKGTFVAGLGLALLAGGCSSVDQFYIRDGIGTELGSSELPSVSQLQDIYIGEICRQAGLQVSRRGEHLLCDEVLIKQEWATIVQAGMNDIDRRCDHYLAWLDNKRRWREPVLKQLGTTAAATAAILGVTGVGAVPIAIVGTAFGFAQESFVNFHARLITEIDQSVIQAVVLDHQNQFRGKIASVPVNNRPAAMYLLRNYLRICMPFSIEMSINNTITTYHRSGPESLGRTVPILERAPEVARRTALIANPRARLAEYERRQTTGPSILNKFEGALTPERIREIQTSVCVSPTGDLGPLNSTTRSAISAYLAGRGKTASRVIDQRNFAFLDEAIEKIGVRKGGTCSLAGFANSRALGASFAR